MKGSFVRVFCLLTMLALSSCRSARTETASTEKPTSDSGCYGFVRQGAVVLKCSGQTQTTPDLGVQGFAVSPDGNYLVLRRSHDVSTGGENIRRINESKLVDLRTKTATETKFYPEMLASSCGKVIAFDDSNQGFNLIAGAALSKPPYTIFRCSADESVSLGYTPTSAQSSNGRVLLTGSSAQKTVSAFNAYRAFDVIRNGEYIAFAATGGDDAVVDRICVTRNGQAPECVENLSIVGSTLSLSDSGVVLFEQHTAQECVYQDQWHFGPSSRKNEENRDGCAGLFRWGCGLREPEAVEPLGVEPQWIPNASLLKEWMSQQIKF